ncbi:UDP-N-acetylmuramoyl-L-alanine--D-glutamate ligase [Streptacidiphilus carbonis]|uniref:UDP-N-acetylmuramoyl-L-alanine--D-glutamate ligase n=1 Tax=Streptacidiphilus carbonis TaxID=105422 RepID=UPI0005A88283|nr:UDP-N-acetylmuramoyl-L-alanine--D-glutamate ligase [Streptacidiphilus carbonis]
MTTGDAPDWTGLPVTVAGLGVSGVPAARVLHGLGARVTVVDGGDGPRQRAQADELRALGVEVVLGDGESLPQGARLVVTSPGWPPHSPLFLAAAEAGVPVWGDVELAWRLRRPHPATGEPAPWLAVTGTNGKTTTVQMLASILTAAGLRTAAVGNVGVSVLDAVLAEEPYDVLAVELSSYQLHWSSSLRPHSAVVLNIAADHLDWHGSMEAYAADKGRIYEGNQVACVYNTADPATEALVREADVAEGCRAIGFTLGPPAVSQFGVVDGLLVDRAFVTDRHKNARPSPATTLVRASPRLRPGGPPPRHTATELASVEDVQPSAPHNIADALAAAALARAYGVEPRAVRDGLRAFRPDAHRIATVVETGGVTYVDDSKATNPHAAAASLAAYPSVVWIAGGLAKGADMDALVAGAAKVLHGVVLMGADRALIREALARHAPEVPVIELQDGQTGAPAMDAAVRAAAGLARPGDTVLLAPACASMDMFTNYGERGDLFAAAARALAEAG